jgi:GT2 family glycosyltransferase
MQDPQIGACGSTLAYYHAKDRIQAFGGATYSPWSGMIRLVGNGSSIHQRPPQEQVEHTFSYIIGASTLFSRPALETVGLFSEDYFLFFEELDWTLRANGRFRITYAPESLVHHKEGGTTRRRDTSETSDLFALRNRLLITKRFFPLYLPSICLGMIGSMALRLVRGQWRRAFFILMLLIASLLGRKLEKMSPLTPSSQNN